MGYVFYHLLPFYLKVIPAGCFAIAFGTEFRTIALLHHSLTKSDSCGVLCDRKPYTIKLSD
jgi:hypothetical protein